uniref:Smg4_UPF3 domain-containing protein n=1 Tax=Macrostomum lignano TaxID=282301 RepID=A0A1I8IJ13_9PLAT
MPLVDADEKDSPEPAGGLESATSGHSLVETPTKAGLVQPSEPAGAAVRAAMAGRAGRSGRAEYLLAGRMPSRVQRSRRSRSSCRFTSRKCRPKTSMSIADTALLSLAAPARTQTMPKTMLMRLAPNSIQQGRVARLQIGSCVPVRLLRRLWQSDDIAFELRILTAAQHRRDQPCTCQLPGGRVDSMSDTLTSSSLASGGHSSSEWLPPPRPSLWKPDSGSLTGLSTWPRLDANQQWMLAGGARGCQLLLTAAAASSATSVATQLRLTFPRFRRQEVSRPFPSTLLTAVVIFVDYNDASWRTASGRARQAEQGACQHQEAEQAGQQRPGGSGWNPVNACGGQGGGRRAGGQQLGQLAWIDIGDNNAAAPAEQGARGCRYAKSSLSSGRLSSLNSDWLAQADPAEAPSCAGLAGTRAVQSDPGAAAGRPAQANSQPFGRLSSLAGLASPVPNCQPILTLATARRPCRLAAWSPWPRWPLAGLPAAYSRSCRPGAGTRRCSAMHDPRHKPAATSGRVGRPERTAPGPAGRMRVSCPGSQGADRCAARQAGGDIRRCPECAGHSHRLSQSQLVQRQRSGDEPRRLHCLNSKLGRPGAPGVETAGSLKGATAVPAGVRRCDQVEPVAPAQAAPMGELLRIQSVVSTGGLANTGQVSEPGWPSGRNWSRLEFGNKVGGCSTVTALGRLIKCSSDPTMTWHRAGKIKELFWWPTATDASGDERSDVQSLSFEPGWARCQSTLARRPGFQSGAFECRCLTRRRPVNEGGAGADQNCEIEFAHSGFLYATGVPARIVDVEVVHLQLFRQVPVDANPASVGQGTLVDQPGDSWLGPAAKLRATKYNVFASLSVKSPGQYSRFIRLELRQQPKLKMKFLDAVPLPRLAGKLPCRSNASLFDLVRLSCFTAEASERGVPVDDGIRQSSRTLPPSTARSSAESPSRQRRASSTATSRAKSCARVQTYRNGPEVDAGDECGFLCKLVQICFSKEFQRLLLELTRNKEKDQELEQLRQEKCKLQQKKLKEAERIAEQVLKWKAVEQEPSISKDKPQQRGSSKLQQKQKLAKPKQQQPTKVVLRRLPAGLSEADFLAQVGSLPFQHSEFRYCPADPELGFCRAYVCLSNKEDLLPFCQQWDGYVFVDAKGVESAALVELAPYQVTDGAKKAKPNPKQGTLEATPEYAAFLADLAAEADRPAPTWESSLEAIRRREKESAEAADASGWTGSASSVTRPRRGARDDEDRRKRDREREKQRKQQKGKPKQQAQQKQASTGAKPETAQAAQPPSASSSSTKVIEIKRRPATAIDERNSVDEKPLPPQPPPPPPQQQQQQQQQQKPAQPKQKQQKQQASADSRGGGGGRGAAGGGRGGGGGRRKTDFDYKQEYYKYLQGIGGYEEYSQDGSSASYSRRGGRGGGGGSQGQSARSAAQEAAATAADIPRNREDFAPEYAPQLLSTT